MLEKFEIIIEAVVKYIAAMEEEKLETLYPKLQLFIKGLLENNKIHSAMLSEFAYADYPELTLLGHNIYHCFKEKELTPDELYSGIRRFLRFEFDHEH